MEQFVATIALIGIVIIVASLLSGVIERIGIPLVGAFLVLGAVVGPYGFGLTDIQLDSPELVVLATLGLALVLFSDAVSVDIKELRARRVLAWVILGPGTILPALLIGLAAFWLLGVSAVGAALLGAALASTDPVLLRTVLRAPQLPATARIGLRIESGMNDVILLPVVVLAIAGARPGGAESTAIGRHLVGLFVLGPILGAMIGWAGITMLATIRDRVGVRRDYESLYALGLGFAAYAAAEAVGGSGFLAAFAAGLAIAALDVELCDCFLEYGEATAEMLLLLTFVAFGTSLIWTGISVANVATIVFAIIAITIRTIVLYPVLTAVGVRGTDRTLIAWFGPRGLSSLLLALLPVFARVEGSAHWFTVTCLVVLLSLVVHGWIIAAFLRRRTPKASVGERAVLPVIEVTGEPEPAPKVTIDEVLRLQERGGPVIFVDSRASRSFNSDDRQITGSARVPPDDPVRAATALRLAQHATLVVYCA